MKPNREQVTFYRQKVLLALVQALGGKLPNIDLQKYLFLFTQLCQKEKSYEFIPYKYGCFSFQSYADRRRFVELGVISATQDFWQLDTEDDFVAKLNESDQRKLQLFKDKYASLKGEDLVREIYRKYPYYAVRSEIAPRLMTKDELKAIEDEKPSQEGYCFFTIGYEGKTFEGYLNQLISNNVHMLCDVRKNPLSRKYGFSKKTLSDTLKTLGIEYVHIPELGIVSEKRQSLHTQKDYDRLFNEYEKTTLKSNRDALNTLYKLFKKNKRVAITCFEAEQCMCHRGRVAKALEKLPGWQYEVKHL